MSLCETDTLTEKRHDASPRLKRVELGALLIATLVLTGCGLGGAERDTSPVFESGGVSDKTYYIGRKIEPVVLPSATGGNGQLRYSINGIPPGLTFDSSDRTLSGAPTSVGRYAVDYAVHDSDNNGSRSDSDLIQFTIKAEFNVLCCTAP